MVVNICDDDDEAGSYYYKFNKGNEITRKS